MFFHNDAPTRLVQRNFSFMTKTRLKFFKIFTHSYRIFWCCSVIPLSFYNHSIHNSIIGKNYELLFQLSWNQFAIFRNMKKLIVIYHVSNLSLSFTSFRIDLNIQLMGYDHLYIGALVRTVKRYKKNTKLIDAY